MSAAIDIKRSGGLTDEPYVTSSSEDFGRASHPTTGLKGSRPKIFVSYFSQESQAVYALLASTLVSLGYDVFEPSSVNGLMNPSESEMRANVANSKLFIAVISPGYFGSKWCMAEADEAMRRNITAVPVMNGDDYTINMIMGYKEATGSDQARYIFRKNVIKVVDRCNQTTAIKDFSQACQKYLQCCTVTTDLAADMQPKKPEGGKSQPFSHTTSQPSSHPFSYPSSQPSSHPPPYSPMSNTAAGFSFGSHSKGMVVSNTECSTDKRSFQGVLGASPLASGRHRWTVVAVQCEQANIYIGVAGRAFCDNLTNSMNDLEREPEGGSKVRAFHLRTGEKVGALGRSKSNYANPPKSGWGQGSVIVVDLDLACGTLAFTLNGQSLGCAFTDLSSIVPVRPFISMTMGLMKNTPIIISVQDYVCES